MHVCIVHECATPATDATTLFNELEAQNRGVSLHVKEVGSPHRVVVVLFVLAGVKCARDGHSECFGLHWLKLTDKSQTVKERRTVVLAQWCTTSISSDVANPRSQPRITNSPPEGERRFTSTSFPLA